MGSVNWDNFKLVHGASAREAFQLMSQLFLNAEVGSRSTAFSPRYPGLEAAPVQGADRRKYGFQAKYFDKGTQGRTKKREIKESLEKIRDTIDCLYIFCNSLDEAHWPNIESDYRTFCTANGKTCPEIKWVVDIEGFNGWLLEAGNENLMQVFFSSGKPIQLLEEQAQNIVSEDQLVISTNLQTIDGSIIDSDNLLKDIQATVLKNRFFVLQGNPGSGKTVLFHQIYEKLALKSLKEDYKERLRLIAKNGLPIFIRARELSSHTLFERVKEILGTYGLQLGQLKLFIVIDGIDELDNSSARRFIDDLNQINSPVYGISGALISVRTANRNKYLLDEIKSCSVIISQLTDEQIRSFFVQKGDKPKLRRFDDLWSKATEEDKSLIRDIHLVVKLYDIIEKISNINKSTILEQAYIYATQGINTLNLLDPQGYTLRYIHEEISENLFHKQGVGLSLADLQQIILSNFERLSYKDVNDIVQCLADGIFEDMPPNPMPDSTINYAHRSWVDFFAASKMAKIFEKDKLFLDKIAQYEDFLRRMFLPVARNHYWSKRDIPKLLALGIVEYYLDAESGHVGDSSPFETRVTTARFSSQIKERVALEGFNLVNQGYVSPSLAMQYLESGFEDIASGLHNNALNRLRKDDEDTNRQVGQDIGPHIGLRLLVEGVDAKKLFESWQEGLIEDDRLEKNSYIDTGHYESILEALIKYGDIDLEWLLEKIDIKVMAVAIKPLLKASRLKNLREITAQKPQLLSKVLNEPLDKMEIIGFIGLLTDSWSENVKSLADKYLKELNEKRNSHLDGYKYSALRYGILRILGLDKGVDLGDHLIVGLTDVFGTLYRLVAIAPNELSETLEWIDKASTHSYYDSPHWSSVYYYANSELVAEILTDQEIQTSTKDAIFKASQDSGYSFIRDTVLPLFIFRLDSSSLADYYTYDELKKVYEKAKDSIEIGDNVNAALNFAPLIAIFDDSEAIELIQVGQNLPVLRYGYHKDVFGFSILEGLETIWEKRIGSVTTRRNYSEEVYKLIVKIQDITDHDETGHLPDQFFEMLTSYDLPLAEKLCTEFLRDNYDDNPVRSILISAKIGAGHELESIRELIGRYHMHLYGEDMVDSYYYEQKFKAYVQIANSEHYTVEDRANNLEDAARQVEMLKTDRRYHRDDRVHEYIGIYYKLRKELERRSLPNYPRKSKYSQNSSYDPSSYRRDEANDQEYMNKIDGLSQKDFGEFISSSQYGSRFSVYTIVQNENLARHLVARAEELKVPYDIFKETVARALTPWSFGRESIIFLKLIYKSPIYRDDFLFHMSHIPQQYSLVMVFKLFKDAGNLELIEETFLEALDCLKLVVRDIKT